MTIATGLSGIKAAAEMTKMLRDGLKEGRIKPDEISGRIGEIYDYIIDSKAALLNAQEENSRLRNELNRIKAYSQHHSVIWRTREDGSEDGPFRPICQGEGREMRLTLRTHVNQSGDHWLLQCGKQHVPKGEGKEPSYKLDKTLVPETLFSPQN